MDRDEVIARLTEAEGQIRDGQVGSNPEEFVQALWTELQQGAPDDMHDEIHARVLAFADLLGLGPIDFPEH